MTDPPSASTPYGYGAQAVTQYGGFWRRLLALILDSIIVGVVASVISTILTAILRASATDAAAGGRNGLIGLVLGILYFGYLWSRNGQTVGYMALGMRLVRADGQPVSFVLGAVRYVLIEASFLLCAIPAIISAFMVGLGSQKQAIHDSILGTLVVRT
jgi:uncharacterized RDD family membrane protein YckC